MIQINAKQQKLQFVKNGPVEYRYVMHVNQYSKLSESKVLDEASTSRTVRKLWRSKDNSKGAEPISLA
jgi:hypothetical protein